jgi:hypothetical protein
LFMLFFRRDDQPTAILVHDTQAEDLHMEVRASSLRLVGIVNSFVHWKYKRPSSDQTTPTLTREAAIERAKEYLKVFKMDVPPDYKLQTVKSDGSHWTVRWNRFSGQYLWDFTDADMAGGSANSEAVFIEFYEKEGLDWLSCHGCCPAPRSLKIKVSKEDAIAKATRYLNQHHTWYEGSRRVDYNGVVTIVHSCDLRVSVPHWGALAEQAALQGLAPRETRLCWRIHLGMMTTRDCMDYKENKRKWKERIAFHVEVWVDAETGKVMRSEDLVALPQ